MKIIERHALIERMAVFLRDHYTFSKIDSLLKDFSLKKIPIAERPIGKFDYVCELLREIDESLLLKIASELDITHNSSSKVYPKGWEKDGIIRVFISHVSSEKTKATSLKKALAPYNINAFVAHEVIQPSLDWQIEIERALNSMDFFISLHTEGFANSAWCQQEVGFAVAKKIKIIPIKFQQENPTGFIAKIQAINRGSKLATTVAKEIVDIILQDEIRPCFVQLIKIDDSKASF